MSEMILEIVDGTDIELTLPVPFDMTLDQGRGPQGPAGPAAGDASVSTLTDVELESLTDLDFLSYDGSSSKWKNGPLTDLISISSEDIEDSTEIGRNVLTAVDAPSAREELGAGTSNFDGNYNSLTGKPDLGTASSSDVNDFDAAGSAAAAQTAAEAYADGIAGAISSDDITDVTTVGKEVLTATDEAAARAAIGAGTSSLALGTSSTTALAGDTAIPSTPADIGAATAAQGALADSAVQPADLDTAITSEVSRADAAYATAAQGGKADAAVQPTRTVNGHALSADVTVTAADVSAVPTTRTVAGHALSADVTVSKSDVGLGNVDNTADSAKAFTESQVTGLTTDLAAKAPLASPALTGNPTAPTQTAGNNSTRLATTAYADDAVAKQSEVLIFALGDETTAITTGTKVTFRMPFAMTLTAVRASLTTASSSGNTAVSVKESGTTVLSTTLTIDATEKTSTTAATPAVISDSALADDAEMTIIVDTPGTGAAGLKVTLIGTRA